MAYAASSLELAVLEAMMHISLDQIPVDTIWLSYRVPDDSILTLQTLPEKWDQPMPYEPSVQAVGDSWIKSGKSLGLLVPATVLPMRKNVLINPAHSRFGEIELIGSGDFTWPSRVLARLRGT